jgi:hypothetical protein
MSQPIIGVRYLALINDSQSEEVTYVRKGTSSGEHIVNWRGTNFVATTLNEDEEDKDPFFQFRERDRLQ